MVNQIRPPTYIVDSIVVDTASKAKVVKKTTDIGVTYTDYTQEAGDGTVSTIITLSSLDTAANGDWLVIGHSAMFNSIAVDVVLPNVNASVLSIYYWNGSAWADATATDGTDSAGACLGVDGSITWTIPAGWVKSTIDGIEAFYVRLSVSAALDATTTLASMLITQVKAIADWRVKVSSINWVQATAQAHRCIVTNRHGDVIFDVTSSEANDFEAIYSHGWVDGLRVPVLGSGKLLINVE